MIFIEIWWFFWKISKKIKIVIFLDKTLCTFIRIYERSPNPLSDWDMIRYFWPQKILKIFQIFEKLGQNQWNSKEINGIHRKSMYWRWRGGKVQMWYWRASYYYSAVILWAAIQKYENIIFPYQKHHGNVSRHSFQCCYRIHYKKMHVF